jgi:hypothetical protein
LGEVNPGRDGRSGLPAAAAARPAAVGLFGGDAKLLTGAFAFANELLGDESRDGQEGED